MTNLEILEDILIESQFQLELIYVCIVFVLIAFAIVFYSAFELRKDIKSLKKTFKE